MVNQTIDNLCMRCGKTRIVVKSWKETINNSVVTFTETACPDKECQKKVDEENTAKQVKRQETEAKRSKTMGRKNIVLRSAARSAH